MIAAVVMTGPLPKRPLSHLIGFRMRIFGDVTEFEYGEVYQPVSLEYR